MRLDSTLTLDTSPVAMLLADAGAVRRLR
jgi:hypothetical protein